MEFLRSVCDAAAMVGFTAVGLYVAFVLAGRYVRMRRLELELLLRDWSDGGPTSRAQGEVFQRADGYWYKSDDGRAYRLGKLKHSPAADAHVERSGALGSAARAGELPGL